MELTLTQVPRCWGENNRSSSKAGTPYFWYNYFNYLMTFVIRDGPNEIIEWENFSLILPLESTTWTQYIRTT